MIQGCSFYLHSHTEPIIEASKALGGGLSPGENHPVKVKEREKTGQKAHVPDLNTLFLLSIFFNLLGLVIPNRPWKELRFAPFAVWEPRETAGSGLACYY